MSQVQQPFIKAILVIIYGIIEEIVDDSEVLRYYNYALIAVTSDYISFSNSLRAFLRGG